MRYTFISIILLCQVLFDAKIFKIENKSVINNLDTIEIIGNIDSEKKYCPDDMVYIYGLMIDQDSEYIEAMQNSVCTNWINTSFPERCASFDPKAWKKIASKLPKKEMEFCIDTYESPNQLGAKPNININWFAASKMCESINKRLCTEEEWSFACEGEEGLPYPYGYVRDRTKCNIDKLWIPVDYSKFNTEDEDLEINRLWQGAYIGEYKDCVSPFGVHDMTGNVDEYTVSVKNTGYPSVLKGGYWSTVRARCRSSTRFHNQWHRFYQQGFRCCSDIR